MSQAEIPIKIVLFGIGMIKGKIIRHISPLSADAIIDKLPLVLRGRFSFGSKKYWTLPGVEIYRGRSERSDKEGKKGDIMYNPKSDELLFLLEDQTLPNKVNKIGVVESNLELILNARNGLNTKIKRDFT
ncbi:MAG: cyclophilin-like fold protein [Promethearchaeati archaeon]